MILMSFPLVTLYFVVIIIDMVVVWCYEDTSNLKTLETSSSKLSSIIKLVNFTPSGLVNLDVSKTWGPATDSLQSLLLSF